MAPGGAEGCSKHGETDPWQSTHPVLVLVVAVYVLLCVLARLARDKAVEYKPLPFLKRCSFRDTARNHESNMNQQYDFILKWCTV